MDIYTKEVFYDKLTFVYLEMPKFNKREDELVTMFDKWLFVLRNLASLLERPAALQERVFTRLFEAAEIAKFSKRELCEYEESLNNFRDMYSVITTAEMKGEARGHAEGELAERQKNAQRMKQKGYPLTDISEITGLSLKEIEEL
jgi:predicted transposase/invertase (TIGR01784 family)